MQKPFAIIWALFILTGCYGATELEARAHSEGGELIDGPSEAGAQQPPVESAPPPPPAAPAAPPSPSVCSSERFWPLDDWDDGSAQMNPGMACISCHQQSDDDDAPRFIVAGTVYATLYELDRCHGVDGQQAEAAAQVEITDARGMIYRLPIGPTGNFFLMASSAPGFEMPFTARVLANGQERRMGGAQSTGDCNQCHTERGTRGAPGRILFPQ